MVPSLYQQTGVINTVLIIFAIGGRRLCMEKAISAPSHVTYPSALICRIRGCLRGVLAGSYRMWNCVTVVVVVVRVLKV